MFLGESSVMFYMNGAKQKLRGRQVLGEGPDSGAGRTTRATCKARSQGRETTM